MAYKRYIKVSKGNINNVKELVANYNKMLNEYSAELRRLYVDWNEDNNRFDVVTPEISIINCDYAYEKYRDKSTIGIDQDGQLEMNIEFPNWATTEKELDDVQRGIQRVYSAKMVYLDFLNEFMMFDEEKYPSTSNTVSDSRRIKDENNVEDKAYLVKQLYEDYLRIDTALREMEQGASYYEQEIFLNKGINDLRKNISGVDPRTEKMFSYGLLRLDTALREMEQGASYYEQEMFLNEGMQSIFDAIQTLEYE